MGSGGGSAGGISQSQKIYNQFLQAGLNSNIKGIRAKAEQGIGNYSFKGSTAVSFNEANNMVKSSMKAFTRGENTLIDGVLPNGKDVYYAGKTESPQIQTLLEKRKYKVDTTPSDNRTTGNTTTYDRAISRRHRQFDEYYFASTGKPDWFISAEEARKNRQKTNKKK